MHIKKANAGRRLAVAAAAMLAIGAPATASANGPVSVNGVLWGSCATEHVTPPDNWPYPNFLTCTDTFGKGQQTLAPYTYENGCYTDSNPFYTTSQSDRVSVEYFPARGGVWARIKLEGDGECDGDVDASATRATSVIPYGGSETLSFSAPVAWNGTQPSYAGATVKVTVRHGPVLIVN
jgi:hypothetical protein